MRLLIANKKSSDGQRLRQHPELYVPQGPASPGRRGSKEALVHCNQIRANIVGESCLNNLFEDLDLPFRVIY